MDCAGSGVGRRAEGEVMIVALTMLGVTSMITGGEEVVEQNVGWAAERQRPFIVDTHVHLIKPVDSKGQRQLYSPNPAGADDYAMLMDKAGIDRAFFISWSPDDIPSDLQGKGIAPESVKEVMNREWAIEAMRKHPRRFYWFPCHLAPTNENYLTMAREHLELGAAGFKLVTSFWGELPDDPRLMPIYDLAREYGAQIIIDTSYWYLGKDNPVEPERLGQGHREVARRVKDFQDYAGHLRKVFAAYPSVNFMLAHAGARDFTPENAREVGELIQEFPNVYADLAALPLDTSALNVLVETAGADRVCFGTDWPHFAQGPAMVALIDQIRRPARFTAVQVEAILGLNASRFEKNRLPGLKRVEVDLADPLWKRAQKLHKASLVVVGHDHLTGQADLLAMHEAGIAAKVLHISVDGAVWSGPERLQQSLHEYAGWTKPALIELERVLGVIEAYSDKLCLIRSAEDIEQAHKQGKSGLLLGFEGGKPIEQNIELLRVFYRLGLRVLQLSWAGGNDICDRRDPPICEGLTPFGRQVVQEMNRLGMLIDVGHASRKTFFETIELSTKPVVSLHATPTGAKPGAGELDDDQVRALAETRGLVGLHFFSHYLNPTEKATVEDLVDHVDYLAKLVGVDHVALGADYLQLTDGFIRAHGVPSSGYLGIPEEFDTYDEWISITRALCELGYSNEEVKKILGGNLLRVLREVL